MRRLLVNIVFLVIGVWFPLLDRCLIVSSGMAVSAKTLTLMILQVIVWVLVLLLANGAFPTASEALSDMRNFR